ncbi:MAG: inorganic phosphate transporter, partial [Gammaproteobacteria bacterium]
LAAIFGVFMAWGIGANDVANAMATSVGSRALTIRHAIIIAAVFEFAGAFFAGGEVTATIRSNIVEPSALNGSAHLLIYGMLASLLAAGIWLLVATHNGWPVSTTHSIVGAIVGFASVGIGIEAVRWETMGTIVSSWVVSPVLAGIIAYVLFMSVQRLILNDPDPFHKAKRYVPAYIFLAGFLVSSVTLLKGLKHVGLELTETQSYLLAVVIGLVAMGLSKLAIRRITIDPAADREFHFASVEKVFGILMIVTACTMAFAHGSNDVANAMGPMAAIISVVESSGDLAQQAPVPAWVLFVGAVGIVAGLMMYGYKVITTVGNGITDLTPSRGFAAELATAGTVVLASGTGLPVSTTHTLVGAILGVGLARGIAALNLRVVRNIFMSWIVTLPAGAILAIIFFYILKAMFM